MKTRTTIELSKALQQIQDEAVKRIKSFFHRKKFDEIVFTKEQFMTIVIGSTVFLVKKITKDGYIQGSQLKGGSVCEKIFNLSELSADSLLSILDELERMKKA